MSHSVLLIEDHALVRSGIRALLNSSNEVKVIGETGDGRQALALYRELQPDVVLADVEMPGLNGMDTARQIHQAHEDARIIMLSAYGDPKYVFEALRAGASGYVLKDSAFPELLTAIRAVMSGRRYFSAPLTDVVIDDYARRARGDEPRNDNDLDKLTVREREVLQLVAEGNTSAEAAARLHVSVRTIDAHRQNVMQKLQIHSIAGLTKFAISHGLTSIR